MKSTTLLLGALPSLASALINGFNIGANNADGSCKTTAQWTSAFKQLASLPVPINTVRLYASSDCNTLANAVPAAVATKTKILAGVWTENQDHYNAEKGALEAAIDAHGSSWLLAVSVGSEDLYRKDTDASTLAQQIYDVRGMLKSLKVPSTVKVGHTDTWTAWVDPANNAVITASDFICNDAYPYFQGASISAGHSTVVKAMSDVKNAVAKVKSGTEVWLCESGWPVSGKTIGNGVPSKANALKYWQTAACPAFKGWNTFWYAYQDAGASPSFGVIGANGKPVYDLKC